MNDDARVKIVQVRISAEHEQVKYLTRRVLPINTISTPRYITVIITYYTILRYFTLLLRVYKKTEEETGKFIIKNIL